MLTYGKVKLIVILVLSVVKVQVVLVWWCYWVVRFSVIKI